MTEQTGRPDAEAGSEGGPEVGSDAADRALVALIGLGAFSTIAVLQRLAADHDLSLTQLRVLEILRDRPQVRIGRLVDHLGLEKSTVTGLVDRAERRGLLRRGRDLQDGRVVVVSLTEQGRDLADRLAEDAFGRLRPQLAPLHPAQRVRLTALLTVLHPEADL
ncbi:MAG TPA: MarR family transcriptional regulator [Cellulomonas sp.]